MFNEDFKHGKKFNINSDDFEFTTLDDYIKQHGNCTLTVLGMFTYKAKFGVRPVLIADNLKINLPDHLLSDVEKIMYNDTYVAAVNAGKCGFKTSQYTDKNGKERNSGSFVDI